MVAEYGGLQTVIRLNLLISLSHGLVSNKIAIAMHLFVIPKRGYLFVKWHVFDSKRKHYSDYWFTYGKMKNNMYIYHVLLFDVTSVVLNYDLLK